MKYISEENLRKWILTENCNDGCGYIDERDLVNMEWEEEPFINKPCISTELCHEDKVKVLEQIRAEIEQKIEQERFARSVFRSEEKNSVKAEQCTGSIVAYNNVIKFIDKYKTESEE